VIMVTYWFNSALVDLPWLREIVAGLLPGTSFNPRPAHMRFVLDEVVLGPSFALITTVFPFHGCSIPFYPAITDAV
jgi:hypothetical protein